MSKRKLKGITVTIRHKGDGMTPGATQTIPLNPETLEGFTIEREYDDGHKEERQVFPTNTTYQPAPPSPWKGDRNDR
jgi:hypothetical protein